MNYAQANWRLKNGHRGHQFVPIAMFVTLYNDNPAHEKEVVKKALKEGIKLEVVSFFDKYN